MAGHGGRVRGRGRGGPVPALALRALRLRRGAPRLRDGPPRRGGHRGPARLGPAGSPRRWRARAASSRPCSTRCAARSSGTTRTCSSSLAVVALLDAVACALLVRPMMRLVGPAPGRGPPARRPRARARCDVSKGWRQQGLPRLTSIRWPSWRGVAPRADHRASRAVAPEPARRPRGRGLAARRAAVGRRRGVRRPLQLHGRAARVPAAGRPRRVREHGPDQHAAHRLDPRAPRHDRGEGGDAARRQHRPPGARALAAPGGVGAGARRARGGARGDPRQPGASPRSPTVQYSPYQPVPILADTPTNVIIYLEEHRAMFPGRRGRDADRAHLPRGRRPRAPGARLRRADHGVRVRPGRRQGHYTQNSIVGKDGIEEYYDTYLRGVDGQQNIEVDANGDPDPDRRQPAGDRPGTPSSSTSTRRSSRTSPTPSPRTSCGCGGPTTPSGSGTPRPPTAPPSCSTRATGTSSRWRATPPTTSTCGRAGSPRPATPRCSAPAR